MWASWLHLIAQTRQSRVLYENGRLTLVEDVGQHSKNSKRTKRNQKTDLDIDDVNRLHGILMTVQSHYHVKDSIPRGVRSKLKFGGAGFQ